MTLKMQLYETSKQFYWRRDNEGNIKVTQGRIHQEDLIVNVSAPNNRSSHEAKIDNLREK